MDEIRDYDIREGMKLEDFVNQTGSAGFQATNMAKAVKLIERMKKEKCMIILTFTANMVATGLRSVFAGMCEKGLVDMIITTGGSIDHDLIRSYRPYLLGDFVMNDEELHKKGINRIGNVLVPNDRYILLEEKIQKIFADVYAKEKVTSPSGLIMEIGKTLEDRNSFMHWCSKKGIPVFSPGITDSAIGLQTYFFKQDHPDFGIDVTKDMKKMADLVLNAEKTGGIILGGGISKHHALGVNLVRDGFDYAVYVTTSSPWDGSLSGARPNEAKSWGKIKETGRHVTVDGDVTIVFPLIVSGFI
ncbi:MAG: deoxyhypusine synthase [Candidatus Aenigmarchaeota archaeon]|nr:deoxyhypusine synthase [Candidatus Aenigmarchaeota archaeon]